MRTSWNKACLIGGVLLCLLAHSARALSDEELRQKSRAAAQSGNVQHLKDVIALEKSAVDPFIGAYAAQYGHIPILEVLYEHDLIKAPRSCFTVAVLSNKHLVAVWLYKRFGEAVLDSVNGVVVIKAAIENGNLDLLRWISINLDISRFKSPIHLEVAAHKEDVKIVRWLLLQKFPIPTSPRWKRALRHSPELKMMYEDLHTAL